MQLARSAYPFKVKPSHKWKRCHMCRCTSEAENKNASFPNLKNCCPSWTRALNPSKLHAEQLTVYRQAVLKHAFEGKLTEEWRKKHADELEPAETLLEKIQGRAQTTLPATARRLETSGRSLGGQWQGGQKTHETRQVQGTPTAHGRKNCQSYAGSCQESWIWVKLSWMTLIDESQNGLLSKSQKVRQRIRL